MRRKQCLILKYLWGNFTGGKMILMLFLTNKLKPAAFCQSDMTSLEYSVMLEFKKYVKDSITRWHTAAEKISGEGGRVAESSVWTQESVLTQSTFSDNKNNRVFLSEWTSVIRRNWHFYNTGNTAEAPSHNYGRRVRNKLSTEQTNTIKVTNLISTEKVKLMLNDHFNYYEFLSCK